MALIACSECGNQVSDKAPTCPHCGAPVAGTPAPPAPHVIVQHAPPAKKSSGCGTLIVVVIVALILFAAIGQCSRESSSGIAVSPSSAPKPAARVRTAPEEWAAIQKRWDPDAAPSVNHAGIVQSIDTLVRQFPTSPEAAQAKAIRDQVKAKAGAYADGAANRVSAAKWRYSQDTDEMTGKTSYFAVLESENIVTFQFPYAGPQHGRLMVREDPQFGFDVMFAIERGQLLCNSWDGCSVGVRIDEAAPTKWSATPAADHSSETLFFSRDRALYEQIRKSKRVIIQPEVFQQGNPTFTFDVSGFDAASFKPQ